MEKMEEEKGGNVDWSQKSTIGCSAEKTRNTTTKTGNQFHWLPLLSGSDPTRMLSPMQLQPEPRMRSAARPVR